MVKVIAICSEGSKHIFKDILKMSVYKGYYTPADELEICFLCDSPGFHFRFIEVYKENEMIFSGETDIQEFIVDGTCGYARITARSYAARLVDNQAKPAIYNYPTYTQIIEKHIKPYGLVCDCCESSLKIPELIITPGTSEWDVVSRFFLEQDNMRIRCVEENTIHPIEIIEIPYCTFSNSYKDTYHYFSLKKKLKTSHLTSTVCFLDSETGMYTAAVQDSKCEFLGIFRQEYRQSNPDEIYSKCRNFTTRFKEQHIEDCVYTLVTEPKYALMVGTVFLLDENLLEEKPTLFVTDSDYIIDDKGERAELRAIPLENVC